MKTHSIPALLFVAALSLPVPSSPQAVDAVVPTAQPLPARQDPRARTLLDEARVKLKSIRSLSADFESNTDPTKFFDRTGQIFLERPNRFRLEMIRGSMVEEHVLLSVSNGQTISSFNEGNFIAYEKPVHQENFFLGQNFLVQFFYDARGIAFDPSDPTWGRAISMFDHNVTAYDRDTRLLLLGARTLQDNTYQVVEIKYNTKRNDIRQQIYIGADKLVYQVDTYYDGATFSQKFRNFKINQTLPATTWRKDKPDPKMPVVATDPVRLGAPAPDFTLPGANGGEVALQELLKGRKGLYVCTFDGIAGKISRNPDAHLSQMRILQEIKDKFEKQGLAVVAVVGGPAITPDLKKEMMLNWLPDLTRFNYPVVIDIDVERGIQGSTYENFNLGGRNNLLLDAKGRVVFAARNFDRDKVNQLAFYQALAQIGFTVSPADLESSAL